MRTEIALIIAETAGKVVGGSLSALGDGRAQYGAALVLASLPFFYIVASIIFLPNFLIMQKLQRHSHKNYFLLGVIWAIIFSLPVTNLGGITAGFSFGAAIVTTFISFSLLIGGENVQNQPNQSFKRDA